MIVRRDRAVPPVRFISLAVGAICFVASFVLLVWIGIFAGFLRLRLFEPPSYSMDGPQTLWGVVVWGGSLSVAILSSWLCLRYAKKFIPPK
jgi:cobalamin biosynthesis protein CobD/CbiB